MELCGPGYADQHPQQLDGNQSDEGVFYEGDYDENRGQIVLTEDLQLNGMIVGTVTVTGGVTLILNGMVVGSLQLEEDSVVKLNGMVNGDVINRGGHSEIYGTVNGALVRQRGETFVDPKSIVTRG